ncbi:MAG: hypothetical protein GPJ54_08600 [Candidatus Heimdallarchaeota archaeon]|nr:hypothetical protein [Candidatus Heimdallarchaeota archaeon]
MTDERLTLWFSVILGFIILFPLLRQTINPKHSKFTQPIYRSFLFVTVASLLVYYLYIEDTIEAPEFQYLEILIIFIYFYSGFNYTEYSWISKESKIITFNTSILKRIGRSFGGSQIEEVDFGQTFTITTPYRLKYRIDTVVDSEKKTGVFILTSQSSNFQIIKLLNLISFYLMTQAVTSNNEDVDFPIFGFNSNSVLAVLFSISVSLVILYIEIETGKNFASSMPTMYTKLLQNEALTKLKGGPTIKGPGDVKGRAQAVLDKRNSNVLKAKKEEVEGRLSSVFGEKEVVPLDKKSIERMRLMQIVKRILNSTPPWKEVSLEEISKLAKGKEEEVEIVIAGLRDLKEVKGIYDIWAKTYYGTSTSHWLITKILNELPDSVTSLENVKIYPDGSGEFAFTKDDK